MMAKTRKFTRFQLTLPVVFSWKDRRLRTRRAKGFTRDLSAGGVFLFSEKCPPLGVPIEFEAILPPLEERAMALRLRGEARVLRVEPAGNGEKWNGFAAINEGFVLQEARH